MILKYKNIFRLIIPLVLCFFSYKLAYKKLISNPNSKISKNRLCLKKGATYEDVLKLLKERKLIESEHAFNIVKMVRRDSLNVIGGCYYVNENITPLELFETIESNNFITKKFKLKPTYYISYLDSILRKEFIIKKLSAFSSELKNNKAIYKKQFKINNNNFEGLFIAKTYELPLYFEASSIIRMLLNDSFNIWNKKFKKQVADNNLDKNKVLTIASILSAETDDARKQLFIARKIILADKKNKNLDLDSTVNYSLDLRGREVNDVHRQAKNPYNTYVIKGLPPGPIGPPTEQAIQTAIDALEE